MKILVVDDSEELHFLIAVWLARAGGFDLHFASNGDDALRRYAKNGPYDVVLTDFGHPGPDGLELARVMRERNPKQSIAMLTGGMPSEGVRSCQRLEIPVLWKPCDAQAFLQLLKATVAIKKKKVAKKAGGGRKAKKRSQIVRG